MADWEWAILAVEIVVLPPLLWCVAGWLFARLDFPPIDWSGPLTTRSNPLRVGATAVGLCASASAAPWLGVFAETKAAVEQYHMKAAAIGVDADYAQEVLDAAFDRLVENPNARLGPVDAVEWAWQELIRGALESHPTQHTTKETISENP